MADGLVRPQPLDVIPAEQVSALIAAADRDFVVLERQAQEAAAAAAAAEADAEAAGIDPGATTWTMVRLQRFLESLRDEAQRDAAATKEVAHRRAQALRDEAGLSAPPATPHASSQLVAPPPAPAVPLASFFADDPPPVSPTAVSGAEDAAQPDSGASPAPPGASTNGSVEHTRGPGGLAVATATAVPVSPVVDHSPIDHSPIDHRPVDHRPVDHTPVDHTPVAPASAPEPVISIPPSPLVSAAPDPTAVLVVPPRVEQSAPPVSAPPAPTPPAAPAPAVAPAKRNLLRRLPVSAILEVIAVLLILVFILLRLS